MNPNKLFKRTLWVILILVLSCYVGAVGWFRANESRLLYVPTKGLSVRPYNANLNYQQVEIKTTDGVKLVCLVVPALPQDSSAFWLLFLHGNRGNALSEAHVERYKLLQDLGFNILAVDYRGYGNSDGEPSEAGLYQDAEAGYSYLRTMKSVPPDRILIYGHSLGSGVAIELATRVPAAGLIVEGAYKSIPAIGQEVYPYVPINLIATNRFESIEKIALIKAPKLFIHAVDDEVIPITHGRALYDKASPPKILLEVSGGHTDAAVKDKPKFQIGITKFVHETIIFSKKRAQKCDALEHHARCSQAAITMRQIRFDALRIMLSLPKIQNGCDFATTGCL